MITSLDFPERRDLSTVLYPRVYLPDLSVEWSEWGIHVSARVRQRGSNVDAVAMGRRRRRRVAGKKRHASAPHDNLEAVVDAVALLALLLALGRLGGGGGGGGVSAHRRWVLYSLLKRVKRRCCCTKRALRTECGMQKGRRCGRTRVFRSAEKFFDRSGLRPVKKNVTLMRVLRPRSKSSFASESPVEGRAF